MIAYRARQAALKQTSSAAAVCVAEAISLNFKRCSPFISNRGRVQLRRVPLPRVPEGFARIRLLAAGICSTDLELQRGYYGFSGTPGHEFVGEVTEAADKSWIGKRVVGEINLACGHANGASAASAATARRAPCSASSSIPGRFANS